MSPSSIVSTSTSRTDSRWQTLILAFCLALSPAVAIGFGRFAYALVLPAMKSDLGWDFSQAGMMGTANAVGYLLGATLTGPALRVWKPRPLLLAGLAVTIVALWGAALSHSFNPLLFFRGLVGFSAAFVFICATGLAARLGNNAEENALAMGITICGPGIGTLLTGILVPLVLEGDAAHWPRAWGLMGLLGLLAFVIVAMASRGMSGTTQDSRDAKVAEYVKVGRGELAFAYSSYFAFGVGYIAYMTFLVAFVRGLNASSGTVTLVWSCLGAAMVGSSWIWKARLARNTGGKTMAFMGLGGMVCSLLPLCLSLAPALTLPILLASAAGFGAMTMPVVTAVTVLIRRHLPVSQWNGAIASVTAVFALGQSIGPFAAGRLSDQFGPSASLWWSAALLGVAAFIALLQKPKQENT